MQTQEARTAWAVAQKTNLEWSLQSRHKRKNNTETDKFVIKCSGTHKKEHLKCTVRLTLRLLNRKEKPLHQQLYSNSYSQESKLQSCIISRSM